MGTLTRKASPVSTAQAGGMVPENLLSFALLHPPQASVSYTREVCRICSNGLQRSQGPVECRDFLWERAGEPVAVEPCPTNPLGLGFRNTGYRTYVGDLVEALLVLPPLRDRPAEL